MRTPLPRFCWLLLSAVALLAACDRDGTGPRERLKLTPGQAAPFALVDLAGLPAAYATDQGLQITVGGMPSLMIYDATEKVHRFMVPDLAPGSAEVVIPAVGNERERTAKLQVLTRSYAGGTPDVALQEMNALLDSMQVSLSFGLAVVDQRADSAVYGRVEAFLTLAEALQRQLDTLPAQERAIVAGLFSAAAPELRQLTAQIAAGIAEMRDQPPVLGAAAITSPLSANQVVAKCVDHAQTLDWLGTMSRIMGYTAAVANGVAWFGGPGIKAAVAIMATALTLATDLAVIIANSVPHLIDPDGLRLEVGPRRLRPDGGQGTMTAWVRRRAGGEVLGSAAGVAMGLGGVVSAIREYERARDLLNTQAAKEAIKSATKDVVVLETLSYLDNKVRDLLAEHVLPAGHVQVTFEGVTLTSGTSSRWEFTGPASAANRGMRTLGQNQHPVESFPLAARIGSGQRCTGVTSGSNPADGINGFQIAASAVIRFLPAAKGLPLEVAAGSNRSATLPLANEGADTARALTYRLQHGDGQAYTPPSWLSVSAPAGPTRLTPGAQGSVRVTVAADGEAPQQQLVVPVAVLENGRVVDNAWVQVQVTPQLSDILVNRSPSTLRLWDHGQQDGDIITVTLNGAAVVSGLTLTNGGVSVPVQYRRGRNVLIVRAHNEGTLRPNTAALGFADVVRGRSTQTYGLSAGTTTQLVITYDPNATAQGPALQRLPAPSYTRCSADQAGDCRP